MSLMLQIAYQHVVQGDLGFLFGTGISYGLRDRGALLLMETTTSGWYVRVTALAL
jgi:hypothetical protein